MGAWLNSEEPSLKMWMCSPVVRSMHMKQFHLLHHFCGMVHTVLQGSFHTVFQGWTLPPKVVTKIAESFAILTFGSSFMHGRFSIVHKNSTNIILILLFLGLSQRWVVLSYVIPQQHETWSGARCTKQRSLPVCHSPGASSYSLPPGYIN